MKEDFLHYVWKYGLFSASGLVTTAGKKLLVKSFGLHNSESGPDFFNAGEFPVISFKSTKVTPKKTDAGIILQVAGDLTMHGVTNSVTFPATIDVGTGHVTANADFIINRRDWQINYDGSADDLIRDDVRMILNIEAGDGQLADAEVNTDPTEE